MRFLDGVGTNFCVLNSGETKKSRRIIHYIVWAVIEKNETEIHENLKL